MPLVVDLGRKEELVRLYGVRVKWPVAFSNLHLLRMVLFISSILACQKLTTQVRRRPVLRQPISWPLQP